jgi:hypothetical protein
MRFFGRGDSVFRGADTTVLSKPAELKDIEPAFKRIYEAARRGHVKEAFDFLLKLTKVPHYLGLSVFTDENWQKFVQCFSTETGGENYKQACEVITNLAVMSDTQKRQEFLSFLCAHYHAYKDRLALEFDVFEADRTNLSGQIKKYLTDELWGAQNLSVYTYYQFGVPAIFAPCTLFLGIMALLYANDNQAKIGFGISALLVTFVGVYTTWLVTCNKYLYEQFVKWEYLSKESALQRAADCIGAFFCVLGYKREVGEFFIGQKSVEQAIRDERNFYLQQRRVLSFNAASFSTNPGLLLPIEQRVINFQRQV